MRDRKKARKLDLLVAKHLSEFRSGDHRSFLKGWGGDFDSVRQWQAGDRRISMPATAKTGQIMAKVFEEPKQLNLWIIIDVSNSMLFGSANARNEAAAVLLMTLGLSAMRVGDLFGIVLFSSVITKFVDLTQDGAALKAAAEQLLSYQCSDARTNLALPLERIVHSNIKNSLVIIISDFYFSLGEKETNLMRQINCSNNTTLLSLVLQDKQEVEPPVNKFLADIKDAEGDETTSWDLSSKALAEAEKTAVSRWEANLKQELKNAHSEVLFVDVEDNYVRQLAKFFSKKSQFAV